MTLRVTLEIVPYGDENHKRSISRLNISNVGVVRDEGFGHLICRYQVEIQSAVFKAAALNNLDDPDEWETLDYDWVEEHDRRDGAMALVAKAAKLVEERL